jgi:hypothetical protein
VEDRDVLLFFIICVFLFHFRIRRAEQGAAAARQVLQPGQHQGSKKIYDIEDSSKIDSS